MKTAIDLKKMLQKFDHNRLCKVRGEAHDAIVGEWIRWWVDTSPKSHLAINPAKYVDTKGKKSYSADILFCSKQELGLYEVLGVTEVENKRKKWFLKLDSLRAYALSQKYPNIEFTLLCVRVYSKKDRDLFSQLLQLIKKTSALVPKITWILYRLSETSGKKDVDFVAIGDDVYWHRFISAGDWILIKNGQVFQQNTGTTKNGEFTGNIPRKIRKQISHATSVQRNPKR